MWRRIIWWWHRKTEQQDLQDELQAHLAIEAHEQLASSGNEEEAALAARRAFGNVTLVAEEIRSGWLIGWIESTCQDIRFGARMIQRNPGFAVVAAITLALGIGATTAIFSAVDETLFRPLPVPEAHRLVNVFNLNTKEGRYVSASFPDYEAYRTQTHALASLSAYVRFPMGVMARGRTERIQLEAVTGDYFREPSRWRL